MRGSLFNTGKKKATPEKVKPSFVSDLYAVLFFVAPSCFKALSFSRLCSRKCYKALQRGVFKILNV